MEYFIPTGESRTELIEKRSHFVGEVFPAQTQEQARACIESVRKHYHDANHHCWCFRLLDGTERYSDDGEPQGTAGQPMLNVFQREGVTNCCCVVTRYFGGILLGAGGLVRAYTRSAKDALDGAGISAVRPWQSVLVPCPYRLLERVKLEISAAGGVMGEIEYTDCVTIGALLAEDRVDDFILRVTDLTAGETVVRLGETVYRAMPNR
ncbi:MAG: YigZ family protein [Pseudoflavonifractor sp.]